MRHRHCAMVFFRLSGDQSMREIYLIISVIVAVLTGDAVAQVNPSDHIPSEILVDCDLRAKSYGNYHPSVMSAKTKLLDLGVFSESDFQGIKIGFCDLASVHGPVATTSCELDTILLDTKYARKNLSLVLSTTLAHEVKHYLQHQKFKAQFGNGYCVSERYKTEKPGMEVAADKFSDNVAGLLFVGRSVEIENRCDAPVVVYIESDNAIPPAPDSRAFIPIAAHSRVTVPMHSASNAFKFYAQSNLNNGRRWVWRGSKQQGKRLIKGKAYQLRKTRLSNKFRDTGPFILRLTCPRNS